MSTSLGLRRFTLAIAAVSTGFAGIATASTALADPLCEEQRNDPSYRVLSEDRTLVGRHLLKIAATVQVGTDPLNRFKMFRVGTVFPHVHKGTILIMPPLSSGFQTYEVGEGGDYDESFAAYFANRGYDVWGYSQRVQGISAGTCESGAANCTAMGEWGVQTLVDDATFIRSQIQRAHPGEDPAVGGMSLGSIAAIALVNAHPNDYAGAFLLEGTLFDTDPTDQAINQQFCSFYEGQLAQGIFYDDQQMPGTKMIAQLASVAPHDPSPIPDFVGLTNHQALVAAFSVARVSPTTPRPNYFFVAGSVPDDHFTYANDELFRNNIAGFTDYVSLRTVRDVNCGMAGERTFTNQLDRYHGALFVNAGGHGFGSAMLDTVALMPKARASVHMRQEFGHVDQFFAVNHRDLTEGPMLEWLQREVFRR